MKQWLEAVKKCYGINIKSNVISDNNKYSILSNTIDININKSNYENDTNIYEWTRLNNKYLLAVGSYVSVKTVDTQETLERIINDLLGDNEAGLYAARHIIIDDMFGLEVCGGIELDDKENIFYASYLSDTAEGYCIVGFGVGEPEDIFDELSGAARTFYRLPRIAVINKGRVFTPLFNSLRAVAKETFPTIDENWSICNTTFQIKDSCLIEKPSVILIRDKDIVYLNPDDIFKDKDIGTKVKDFISHIPDLYDISGFTITNFIDNRYGITYYPLTGDEIENNNFICDHSDCSHDDIESTSTESDNIYYVDESELDREAIKDEEYNDLLVNNIDFNPILKKFGESVQWLFDKSWKYGMVVIVTEDEYLSLSVYYSIGGSYIQGDTPSELDNNILNIINSLGETIEKVYKDWNVFYFSFEREDVLNSIDINSIKYEAFIFDMYIDSLDENIIDDTLMSGCNLFYDELNRASNPINTINFKLSIDDDGLFVIEPGIGVTPKGFLKIESFNDNLLKIYPIIDDIFSKNPEYSIISVTLFPEGKFGYLLDTGDTRLVINRTNLDDLLEEMELLKYKDKIEPLIRDEILGLIYEVDSEESLSVGTSKIGGSPDLADPLDWATDSTGECMSFIAQINMQEIAPFDKENILPKDGLLTFFYSVNSNQCKVIYHKDISNLRLVYNNNCEVEEYFPAKLRFVPSISLPTLTDNNNIVNFINEEDKDEYLELSGQYSRTKIFGYADIINEDMEEKFNQPMKLLFQLESVDSSDMFWLDAGTLYFWISEEDLKKKDFSKVICKIQSY